MKKIILILVIASCFIFSTIALAKQTILYGCLTKTENPVDGLIKGEIQIVGDRDRIWCGDIEISIQTRYLFKMISISNNDIEKKEPKERCFKIDKNGKKIKYRC